MTDKGDQRRQSTPVADATGHVLFCTETFISENHDRLMESAPGIEVVPLGAADGVDPGDLGRITLAFMSRDTWPDRARDFISVLREAPSGPSSTSYGTAEFGSRGQRGHLRMRWPRPRSCISMGCPETFGVQQRAMSVVSLPGTSGVNSRVDRSLFLALVQLVAGSWISRWPMG